MRFSEVISLQGFASIGWVQKAHNLKGEVFIRLFSSSSNFKPAWANNLKKVLLTHDGKSKSYSIEKLRFHKDGLILKFENVNSRTEAESLKTQQVDISEDLLKSSEDEKDFYYREVLNFHIFTQSGENKGEVVGFESGGPQEFLIVKGLKKNFNIPFSEGLIVKIDFKNKKLILDWPEGLEDL